MSYVHVVRCMLHEDCSVLWPIATCMGPAVLYRTGYWAACNRGMLHVAWCCNSAMTHRREARLGLGELRRVLPQAPHTEPVRLRVRLQPSATSDTSNATEYYRLPSTVLAMRDVDSFRQPECDDTRPSEHCAARNGTRQTRGGRLSHLVWHMSHGVRWDGRLSTARHLRSP